MNTDALATVDRALREITESQHLLQALVTSSESFDYVRAKAALTQIERKVRTLAKLQSSILSERAHIHGLPANVVPLPNPPEAA
jgi:hypothetical protein